MSGNSEHSEDDTSLHPGRAKRSRVLISSQYEEKIDLIDKKLSRLNRLVESLITDNSVGSMGISLNHQDNLDYALAPQDMPSRSMPVGSPTSEVIAINAQSSSNRVGARPNEITNQVTIGEGQSSLKAHSAFAIDFAHYVVGSSQPPGQDNHEIGQLLDTLHHIKNASDDHRFSSKPLFPLVHATTSPNHEQYDMPPLRAAVQLLREAEGLASDRVIGQNDTEAYNEHNKLVFMCQTNLETALSKLTLYVKPSYEMVLALILGIVYAINISNTSLAWVLVGTAYQCSHSLGFHTHLDSSDDSSHKSDRKRLLFWAVYFFEKNLSVRLGRSSIITNCDITALSLEGLEMPESHAICYAYQIVNLAGLAGRIYEQLYSADALRVTEDTRTRRALELSQELYRYCAEARDTNQLWAQSSGDECEREQIHLISASDEVLRLSMLTLIYRAMPPEPNSGTTFGLDCITSARCALESHQVFIRGFGMQASSLILSEYINWTILFTPFVPFIVMFCHTIETRDKGDLDRMYAFLKSIECACQHSNAIAKHHHLFGVLYSVALRYTELGSPSSRMEEEQLQLRSEVDAHLSALGLQPHTTYLTAHHTEDVDPLMSSVQPSVEAIEQNRTTEGNNWAEEPWLRRWFSFNQQMIGLFDDNYLPF
ncbi:hypothetical protein PENSOL_c004G02767 [Penicillium solitum]|uniref:Xylanolytic transcriptional activator regulatory domain-containing protein n=1 Tax=Penicillium solitum TaxID=60172 RepID=A0A1V6RI08_9EURO|nr:uncharacterized protein PENSOL_c004G02767 [Penicillium solitum]OQE01437.1 hypothetical protein PENSOL_c004G02767 [Penicillium solitum]